MATQALSPGALTRGKALKIPAGAPPGLFRGDALDTGDTQVQWQYVVIVWRDEWTIDEGLDTAYALADIVNTRTEAEVLRQTLKAEGYLPRVILHPAT